MKGLKILSILSIFILISLISGCSQTNNKNNISNPASVYCLNNNGTLEIRTNLDGSQTGYCIFLDGSECEEWLYYRNNCTFGSAK